MASTLISFNSLCLPHFSFEQDVALLAEAGIPGIGLYNPKLETRSNETIRQAMADAGLRPTSCLPSPENASMLRTPGFGDTCVDRDERIRMHSEAIRRFGDLGGLCYVCGTGPVGSLPPKEAWSRVVEMLGELGDVAAKAGICVSIEPFSPEWLEFATMLTTLGDGIEMVREVGHPYVKLLFDPWHLWDSPDLHQLLADHVDDLAPVVHMSDVREPTRSWADRLVPGTGKAGLPAILATLATAGYNGWYDLEILSDDGLFEHDFLDALWKLPEAEFVATSVSGLRACMPA
jgi:sugar phosphate isomerase/epimerase